MWLFQFVLIKFHTYGNQRTKFLSIMSSTIYCYECGKINPWNTTQLWPTNPVLHLVPGIMLSSCSTWRKTKLRDSCRFIFSIRAIWIDFLASRVKSRPVHMSSIEFFSHSTKLAMKTLALKAFPRDTPAQQGLFCCLTPTKFADPGPFSVQCEYTITF